MHKHDMARLFTSTTETLAAFSPSRTRIARTKSPVNMNMIVSWIVIQYSISALMPDRALCMLSYHLTNSMSFLGWWRGDS